MQPKVHVSDAVLERFRIQTSATAYSAVYRLSPPAAGQEFVIKLIDEERGAPEKYYPISEETKARYREWKRKQGERRT